MGAFKTYFIDVIKNNYCNFSGRARRKEYWMFMLFFYVAMFAIGIVMAIVGAILGPDNILSIILTVAIALASLGLIPTMLGLLWRRLHDIGKSGAWFLIGLIPFGGLVLFVFSVLDSQPGANQYGPNPKGMESPAASDVFV